MTTLDIIQGQQAALLQTPPDLETWTTLERRRIARESASKGGRKVTDAKREANRRRAIKYWAEVRAGIRPPRRAQQQKYPIQYTVDPVSLGTERVEGAGK